MQGFKLILQKELTRVFKDKKMIFSLFILPVVLIVGIYGLMFALISSQENDIKTHASSVYIVNAPESFKAFIEAGDEQNVIEYLNSDAQLDAIKDDIKNGDKELLIVFPENFADGIKDVTGKTIPEVRTYYNPSEDYSANARNMYLVYLESYRQVLLSERIGDLSKITMFGVDVSDPEAAELYDDAKASGKILGMLVPYIITIMLFAGAMGLGVDTFTGEKERGTMSSLLITPVSRMSIAMGKIVSLMILSVLSAAAYVLSMVIMMPLMASKAMSGEAISSLSIKMTPVQIIELALIVIALVYLYVSIVSLVAVFAKTSKEASSYIMPAYMLVIVVGMLTMYGEATTDLLPFAIPIYNGPLAIKALFAQSLTPVQCLLSVASTLLASFVVTYLIAKMFNNEKIMGA